MNPLGSATALEEALRRLASPLPGSVPMDNHRPVNIRAAHDRLPLVEALAAMFPHVKPAEWESRCDAGRLLDVHGNPMAKHRVVRAGERLFQVFPGECEPPVATAIRVIHLDDLLLLLHKPAPLPMHACGRYHRNTLQHLLNLACDPISPKPVHRLDANTSGLVMFALDRPTSRAMQDRFLSGDVEKTYLVRVVGHPPEDRFSCNEKISSQPGVAGIREAGAHEGRAASTRFRVVARHADGTALLEAVLLTGRTNQIRAHLWQAGHPVAGDPSYGRDGALGSRQTILPDDPPLQLHAWKLAFTHPRTGGRMEFLAEPPQWAGDLLPSNLASKVAGSSCSSPSPERPAPANVTPSSTPYPARVQVLERQDQ